MPTNIQHSDPAGWTGETTQRQYQIDLDRALEAARIGIWQWDPATGAMSCNRRMRKMCRIPREPALTFELFLSSLCTEDRNRTRISLLQTFRDGATRSIECRLAEPDAAADRWIVIEGRPCSVEGSTLQMVGAAQDISARKSMDAQRELAAREMEHRIHNVFMVMNSIVELSAPFAVDSRQLARSLEARICALARAHGLLRSAQAQGTVELQHLIEGELAPFTALSNVAIRGEQVRLAGRRAVAMNMIVHELTTNAAKHGALSHAGGRVSIDWTIESSMSTECLVLRWKEYCAHDIKPPADKGIGVKLLTSSARANLRGDILLEFESDGLHATLVAPLSYLTKGG
jgi:two-component sensor histidine kinase